MQKVENKMANESMCVANVFGLDGSSIENVLDLLKDNIDQCVYSYIDLVEYGTSNPNFCTFLVRNDNDQILSIFTKYYDSIQIYDLSGACDCVAVCIHEYALNNGIKAVFGESSIIKAISRLSNNASIEYGHVAKYSYTDRFVRNHWNCIEEARSDCDFKQIAELICSDSSMGSINEKDQLAETLNSRYKSGFGRSLVIRINGDIVAHAATYAEIVDVAVIGGVITRIDQRGNGYSSSLVSYLCNILSNEKKQIYLFWYSEGAFRIYSKIGFENVVEWAKLIIAPKAKL